MFKNQRVTEKIQKLPRADGIYYCEWVGLRGNGPFSINIGKLGHVLSETWIYFNSILILVNGLVEGGIEQHRIGLNQ